MEVPDEELRTRAAEEGGLGERVVAELERRVLDSEAVEGTPLEAAGAANGKTVASIAAKPWCKQLRANNRIVHFDTYVA